MNTFNSSQPYGPDARTTADAARTDAALSRAYARGRRDERAARRGSRATFALLMLAALAGLFVALSNSEGSFTRGGQVLDRHISSATEAVSQATKQAANAAGDAMREAGDKLKQAAAG